MNKVTIFESGRSTSVALNGHELAGAIGGLSLQMSPNNSSELRLDVLALNDISIEGVKVIVRSIHGDKKRLLAIRELIDAELKAL